MLYSQDKRTAIVSGMNGSGMSENSYQRFILKDIVTEVHLGFHPWEQHPERPQRVIVNVEMFAADSPARDFENAGPVVDYDPVRREIRDWPNRPHTKYIETLLEELVALCFENPAVTACRVSLVKPDIFNEAAGAGVEIYRVRPTI